MTIAGLILRPLGSEWVALNRRDKGFASFGYSYPYLGEALDAWKVRLVGCGTDEHGLYLVADSRAEEGG